MIVRACASTSIDCFFACISCWTVMVNSSEYAHTSVSVQALLSVRTRTDKPANTRCGRQGSGFVRPNNTAMMTLRRMMVHRRM